MIPAPDLEVLIKNLTMTVQKMDQKFDTMNASINDVKTMCLDHQVKLLEVKNDVSAIDDRVKSLESNISFNDKDVFENAVNDLVAVKVREATAELNERYDRKTKLIVQGVAVVSGTDDTEIVKNIADKLGIDLELSEVVRTFRVRRDLASTDTRPTLLNVEFVSERVKKKFVHPDIRAKIEALAPDDPFKGLLMYHDSTYAQRQEYRVLKAQAQAKNDLCEEKGTRKIPG
ncbi:unnamed protein product [Meganyctiphanes norvegica]|uniref:Uncharacterized protein n=1 Tax=Meganyctiphanes norvegica TaxID=48144 RepID=A0AAV2RDY1_MEGNR